jgi:predicted  nucleic acid-binding Zn-ribbon protein
MFKCMECGQKLTTPQAESALSGNGCPRCGGSDVDVEPKLSPEHFKRWLDERNSYEEEVQK